ncbi:hypothetical protein A0256_10540 [Mucilaginibacter sp. PAMC 26640]|nr:hypothetical protein A0256_10540 [Mucilaginibacter sp. PAMC 26640]
MPGLSFFIPAYNCANTIGEAVDSIMESNFAQGDELIIVNDCSSDDTATALANLKAKYPGISTFSHSINKGGAAARNTAVENAKHDLLFCLDADNVLAPNSIKQLLNYLIINNADVASFQNQHFFLNNKLKPDYTWTLPAGEIALELYLSGQNTPGQHGNYLFTKQSWRNAHGYAEGTGALDTWTFGLRQAISGAKTVVLKDSFYYHRLNYGESYWMTDAEANMWSVSLKAAHALFPFYNRIEESYLNYMLGAGRYTWFYELKKRNLKLVGNGAKEQLYQSLQKKLLKIQYPKPTFLTRAMRRLKRIFK